MSHCNNGGWYLIVDIHARTVTRYWSSCVNIADQELNATLFGRNLLGDQFLCIEKE